MCDIGGFLNMMSRGGYGLPVGDRFVGSPRVGLTTSEYGREREMPMQGEASTGLRAGATLSW